MSTAPPGSRPPRPSAPPLGPAGASRRDEPTPAGPQWKAWTAWVALVAGFAAADRRGDHHRRRRRGVRRVSFDDPPASVNILSLVVQDVCPRRRGDLVRAHRRGAAARRTSGCGRRAFWTGGRLEPVCLGRVPRRHGGVGGALGIDEPSETLPKQLGVDDSTLALIAVAILVCVGAPLVRGVLLPRLLLHGAALVARHVAGGADHRRWCSARSTPGRRRGVPRAARRASGSALCLLYACAPARCYPCIARTALNNSLAFGVVAATGTGRSCRCSPASLDVRSRIVRPGDPRHASAGRPQTAGRSPHRIAWR